MIINPLLFLIAFQKFQLIFICRFFELQVTIRIFKMPTKINRSVHMEFPDMWRHTGAGEEVSLYTIILVLHKELADTT